MGYIGSHTVVELINAGFEPVIDNLSNSSLDVLQRIEKITDKRIQFEKFDLRVKNDVTDFLEKIKTSKGLFILRRVKLLKKV